MRCIELAEMGCKKLTYHSNLKLIKGSKTLSSAKSVLKERRVYIYGFQGQEDDPEIKGEGNSVNYKYRMHDPRIGRFFAVDPLSRDYPHYTPYSFSGNKVIAFVELEGLEELHYLELKKDGTWGAVKINGKNWVDINNDLDENVNVYLYYYPNGGGVKKSVYKSHQQGGKDRWENKGGIAPSNLLSAHYDTDKHNVPTDADRINSTPYDPWEGGAEAGNNDSDWTGERGFYERGGPLLLATVGTILSGGTLLAATETGAVIWASGSLILSLDEFTGLDGDSWLEQAVEELGGETAKNIFKGAKLAFSIKDLSKGLVNLSFELADGKTLEGVYDVINETFNVVSGSVDVGKTIKEGSD